MHEWDEGSYSDVAGDIDFSRSFPANWQLTAGTVLSGPYPLSEPETRGLAEFVCPTPTSVERLISTQVIQPFSTLQLRWRAIAPAEDAALIAHLGQIASTVTGFRC